MDDKLNVTVSQEMLTEMMRKVLFDEDIECPHCETYMDPDQEKCVECGRINPLKEAGLI